MDTQNDAPRGDAWVTIEYVEGLFDVTRKTVVGWLDSGELPHYRLGPRTIRIARADLEQFVADRRRTSLADGRRAAAEELDIRSRCSAPGEEAPTREAAA